MNKRMKCFIVSLIVFLGVLTPQAVFAAEGGIKVFLDGTEIEYDVPPQIISGRTMVPLSLTVQAITGSPAEWNNETKTVTFVAGGHTNVHKIGETIVYADDTPIEFDTPSTIIDSRTLVPVRMIAETSGCTVDWDGENRYVLITSPEGTQTAGEAPEILEYSAPSATETAEGAEFKVSITTNGTVLRVWIEEEGGESWEGTLVDAGNEDGMPKWEVVCKPAGTGQLKIYAGLDDNPDNAATEVIDFSAADEDLPEETEEPQIVSLTTPDGTEINKDAEFKVLITTNGSVSSVWIEGQGEKWQGKLTDAGNEDGKSKWEVVCYPKESGELKAFAKSSDPLIKEVTKAVNVTVN